jgi:uncharacterized RDD family membrane protein YckC
MDNWYYRQNGEQQGPVSQEALIELFRTGQLPVEELVWSPTMEDWQAAYTIPGLLPPELIPPRLIASDQPASLAPTGPQARPWLRYWARSLDMVIFSLPLALVFSLVYPRLLAIKPGYLNFLYALAYIFVEPLILSTWGTTPGKALLKIRLRKADGSKLSYYEALVRSVKVWIRGLGLALPVINMITHVMAYQRLLQQGRTSWDEDGGFTVTHQILGTQRIMLVVIAFVAFAMLIAVGIHEVIQEI